MPGCKPTRLIPDSWKPQSFAICHYHLKEDKKDPLTQKYWRISANVLQCLRRGSLSIFIQSISSVWESWSGVIRNARLIDLLASLFPTLYAVLLTRGDGSPGAGKWRHPRRARESDKRSLHPSTRPEIPCLPRLSFLLVLAHEASYSSRTTTLRGTVDVISPEVVSPRGQHHQTGWDWNCRDQIRRF